MVSVPDFSQAPAAAAVELVTPPDAEPVPAPVAAPEAEDPEPGVEAGSGG